MNSVIINIELIRYILNSKYKTISIYLITWFHCKQENALSAFSYLPYRLDHPQPPQKCSIELEHLYVYDKRGFSIGTPIYMDVVHIIFFFPIVTPPLTWLFLLEHFYTVSEDSNGSSYIVEFYCNFLRGGGGGDPARPLLGQSQVKPTWKCHKCGLVINFRTNIKRHSKTCQAMKNLSLECQSPAMTKTIKCDMCTKSFSSIGNLRRH